MSKYLLSYRTCESSCGGHLRQHCILFRTFFKPKYSACCCLSSTLQNHLSTPTPDFYSYNSAGKQKTGQLPQIISLLSDQKSWPHLISFQHFPVEASFLAVVAKILTGYSFLYVSLCPSFSFFHILNVPGYLSWVLRPLPLKVNLHDFLSNLIPTYHFHHISISQILISSSPWSQKFIYPTDISTGLSQQACWTQYQIEFSIFPFPRWPPYLVFSSPVNDTTIHPDTYVWKLRVGLNMCLWIGSDHSSPA